MKKFFSLLALVSLFCFTACEEEKPTPKPEPQQLQQPLIEVTEVTETGFTVAWNAVENAADYTVVLNEVSEVVAETTKTYTDLAAGTYTVKVKANAPQGSELYLDSEFDSQEVIIEGVPEPTELTFEFGVEDLTSTSATVWAYPSDKTMSYYFDTMSLEEFEMFEPTELCDLIVELWAEMGAEEGLSLEETLEIMCSVGDDKWTPTAMEPNTDYVVYAFGLNYDGTYTSELQHHVFRTLWAEGPGDVNFVADQIWGAYYGEMYTPGWGNYWFFLTDNGFDEYGWEYPNSTYYRIDLYAPLVEDLSNIQVPVGTYTLDPDDTYAVGTFSVGYSCYWQSDAEGNQKFEPIPFDSGTLEVTEEGMTLEVVIAGETHYVTFEGTYNLTDESPSTMSTLTEDLEVDMAGCTIDIEEWGDYWGCGYCNWYIMMYPNVANGNRVYFQFDLISAYVDAASGYLGTYTGSFNFEPSTYITGFNDGGQAGGSWYFEEDGNNIYNQAPLSQGTLEITLNEDGTHTFELEAYDDAGNLITMSHTADLSGSSSAPARAMVPAKKMSAKQSFAPVRK